MSISITKYENSQYNYSPTCRLIVIRVAIKQTDKHYSFFASPLFRLRLKNIHVCQPGYVIPWSISGAIAGNTKLRLICVSHGFHVTFHIHVTSILTAWFSYNFGHQNNMSVKCLPHYTPTFI